MRILVTGATGMLGVSVCRTLQDEHAVLAAGHEELDVTDAEAVRSRLQRDRPDWVVHLAALTDVDRCQREPERAMAVNAASTETIAAWCGESGGGLLLLSSIAVFDGTKASPYVESDEPRPANAYGESKRRAERAAARLPDHLVVRTGWLFSGRADDRKFVGQILRRARESDSLDVVCDRFGSPTWVEDLATGIRRAVSEGLRGVVHIVNEGSPASRVDVAREVVTRAGLPTRIRPVSSDFFPGLAPRPAMEAARSGRTDGWLRPWRDALGAALPTSPRPRRAP
ncbi:MAG TPA: NAD(P)-dependent oxidoreductase [Vicinamibacteria bacterium]